MKQIGPHFFNIELVETYPCNDKDELTKREGYWIRKLKATLNMSVAGRTLKEYRADNCENIKKQRQEHYKQHADTIRQRQSEQHTCSICGSTYTYSHKARHERTQKHLKALEDLERPPDLRNGVAEPVKED